MQQEEERSFRRPSFTNLAPGYVLVSIVVSLVCPYMFAAEFSQRGPIWLGLLLSGLFPLGGIVYALARRQGLDVIGVGALLVILGNLFVVVFAANLANYTLYRALAWGVPLALLALVTLLSQAFARPLLYYGDRFFSSGGERRKLAQYDAIWARGLPYRARVSRFNLLWALAQLVLALIMAALPFLLTGWSDEFSLLLVCLVYIGLAAWTQQRKSAWQTKNVEE